ncbi:MAG TPA: DNA-directed RNA polymerase subunit alpha [Longimicrobiaceae bacterium]|nr:DNA-directed RNA polymerase subunit alpha [Longimicrobiaceae bacterium]
MVELDLTGLQMPNLPEQPREGQIVLRPLERGFGHTLGNTMRRILLSQLRGAAVWAFRTDGVLHEHQTIAGVVEDVHQVIRNLKALVLKMDEDVDEATLELRATKAGAVTARDIREHASVKVVNPEHHILTLQDDRDLRMELYVNKGRGFVLAEVHPIPRGMPADLVRIDAIYNPVRRANFVVEETRVGQRTDFDRLVLDVETNGAVDVPTAVQYAAKLAIEHFGFLAGARPEWVEDRGWGNGSSAAGAESPFTGGTPVPPRVEDVLSRPIEDLAELSVRSRNSLQKENIQTVRDLIQRTEDQMLAIDNFGKKSLQEINEFLSTQGLRFGIRLAEGENGTLWWSENEDGNDEAAGGSDEENPA